MERSLRYARASAVLRVRRLGVDESASFHRAPDGRIRAIIPSAGRVGADGIPFLVGALELLDHAASVQVVITNGEITNAGLKAAQTYGADIVEVDSADGFNFSTAVNAGVRASAGASRILLLNDDVGRPASPDWLRWWSEQAAPLSSVALQRPDGRLAYGGIRWGSPRETPSHRFAGWRQEWVPRRPRTLAVTAAAMLVDRELFDAVGGFCEELPLNYNDIDFCVQALALGVRARQFNRVVLTHRESASRGAAVPSEREFEVFERRCAAALAPYGIRLRADR